jgi:hypothetical protein
MAVSGTVRRNVGPQAHTRMQQLYASAEGMRAAADAARAQHGEASHEYSAALDSWNFALQYLDLFIRGLVTAAMDPAEIAACQHAAHRSG